MATGRAVVYYVWSAKASSVIITCLHCMYNMDGNLRSRT